MVSETSVQYNVEFSAAFQIVEFHKRVVVSPCFPQQPQIQALENAPGDDRISQPNYLYTKYQYAYNGEGEISVEKSVKSGRDLSSGLSSTHCNLPNREQHRL